jgi:CheY-like chemotaxis protein
MNKKTIVLADNSYTIRRIVELSLSEENVELVSFENGLNLQQKLLDLKPDVVLVDIKLPEMSGYEVCKFIADNDTLNHTKVFLMKGGFDPLDENQIKNLQYEDIITKPFDSSTLISSIKKVLEAKKAEKVEEIPSSIPEDVPEIDSISEAADEISFSDIKDEIDSDPVPREEVQPSEEVTVMAHGEKEDQLKPSAEEDDISNPFMDEAAPPPAAAEAQPVPEAAPPTPETAAVTPEPVQTPPAEPAPQKADTMPEDKLEAATAAIPAEEPAAPAEELQIPKVEEPPAEDLEDLMPDAAPVEEMPSLDEPPTVEEEPLEMAPDSPLGPPQAEAPAEPAPVATESPLIEDEPLEEAAPVQVPADDIQVEEPAAQPVVDEDIEVPAEEPHMELEIDQGTSEPEPPLENQPEIVEPAPPEEPDIAVEGPQEIEKPLVEKETTESAPSGDPISMISKDEMLHKVEDKLTVAIKEVLWEVIPPLAEKIITEEIERIKSKIDQEAV